MNKNEINYLIQEAVMEMELSKLDKEMEVELAVNEAYMKYLDYKYEDKLRDQELVEGVRHKMTNLLVLINAVNEIEEKAIAINNHDIMWRCELRKAKMTGQMGLLRDKYDL